MTHEQLNLAGGARTIVDGVELTARQQIALELIRRAGPVPDDELGAVLHEERAARGGRGHPADHRCSWCGEEGKSMGDTLRGKGLVRFRRGLGWVAADSAPAGRKSAARPAGADFGEFPEGF
jgi:hypothetical protein